MSDNALATQQKPLLTQVTNQDRIVVVSGLPRSGTSMLMYALQAGGMTLLTDQIRAPDIDNPKGYYEFERVKRLPQGDVGWLEDACGKCVKIISALLTYLPSHYRYGVIFMHRNIDEVLASQRKMLARRGQISPENDNNMKALLLQHVNDVRDWLVKQPHFALFDADYNAMLADPASWVVRINAFLGGSLDVAAMQAAVDTTLYRNRGS
jgi:hypothetical protein